MIFKYLLLLLTAAVWLGAIVVAWPARSYMTSDFVEFCGRLATWHAQAQLVAMLVPLARQRSLRIAGPLLLACVASYAMYWLRNPPAHIFDGVIQLSCFQFAVLVPVAVALRWFGWRLDRNKVVENGDVAHSRQFTLQALLGWTTLAALYCLLVRTLDRELVSEWITGIFFIALPACLSLLSLWAALGAGGIVWRPAIPIAVVIASANLLGAVDNDSPFSAWQAAVLFGSPTLLVWLTCISLRTFDWRIMRRKSQPLQPANDGLPMKNV